MIGGFDKVIQRAHLLFKFFDKPLMLLIAPGGPSAANCRCEVCICVIISPLKCFKCCHKRAQFRRIDMVETYGNDWWFLGVSLVLPVLN